MDFMLQIKKREVFIFCEREREVFIKKKRNVKLFKSI